jgi:hypothetical protein
MPKPKPLNKEDILRAHRVTKSNLAAARYLHCSYQHYRKYASIFKNDQGVTLLDEHKNQCGKGIPKFLAEKGLLPDVSKILDGSVNIDSFAPSKIRDKLIAEGYLKDQCYCCGYDQRRNVDNKIPLLVNFKDKNKRNWDSLNTEMLCYNCYFLNVGDIFTNRQIQGLEDYKPIPNTEKPTWEMDDYFVEHFKELGIIPPDEAIGSEFISRH